MQEAHDPYAALRHSSFRRLLAGTFLAGIASEVQSVALGWELYTRTHNPLVLGLVGICQFLPVLFFSLPAGHLADLYSRKYLLATAHLLAAVAALGLLLLSEQEGAIAYMYCCLVIAGVGQACRVPARSALISQVVDEADLSNAVTWNSGAWQLSAVLGPALGGAILYVNDGRAALGFVVAVGCTLTCALLAASLKPRASAPRPVDSSTSLLDGFRFIQRTPIILATLTLDLFAVLLGGATALMPVFAKDILDAGPQGLGLLKAAPSVGAVMTAVWLTFCPPFRRPGQVMLCSVVGFGLVTLGFGMSDNLALSIFLLAATGAFDYVSVVIRGTLVQVLTPDELRGRVGAVNAIFIGTSNEVGAFESGATAWLFGPVVSVVSGGMGSILVALLVWARWPSLSSIEPLSKKPMDVPAAEEAAGADLAEETYG